MTKNATAECLLLNCSNDKNREENDVSSTVKLKSRDRSKASKDCD